MSAFGRSSCSSHPAGVCQRGSRQDRHAHLYVRRHSEVILCTCMYHLTTDGGVQLWRMLAVDAKLLLVSSTNTYHIDGS